MAVYSNLTKNSPITSVEFSPVANGNFTFVYVNTPSNAEITRQFLTSPEINQQIIAETSVNGKPVLVTSGDKTKDQLMQKLEEGGEHLKLKTADRKFNPWVVRGAASMIGQPLQLLSAVFGAKGMDSATATFAISNIIANITNIAFGAEKSNDTHRLTHLKKEVNQGVAEACGPDHKLIAPDDNRMDKRSDPEPDKSIGDKATDFMRNNSVKVGEIGLRYFGAATLVLPVTKDVVDAAGKVQLKPNGKKMMSAAHWKTAMAELGQGQFKSAINRVLNHEDKFTMYAGAAYLLGKSLAFTSKVPDPYDPKPHTWVDTLREKVVFPASSVIETIAAAFIVYDRLGNKKDAAGKAVLDAAGKAVPRRAITWPETKLLPKAMRGAKTRDWLGGVGGLLFMSGLVIRIFAPFGEKQIDMDELHAHVSDTLAKTPPEKLPQLMADTAATLKENLKGKVEYGELFTDMMNDLYTAHHKSLQEAVKAEHAAAAAPAKQHTTESLTAAAPESTSPTAPEASSEQSAVAKYAQNASSSRSALTQKSPASSHAEAALDRSPAEHTI